MKPAYRLFLVLTLLPTAPAGAQALTGIWQGVETDIDDPDHQWPAVLRLQKTTGSALFGVLYQEVGDQPNVSVTFQVLATPAGPGLRLEHQRRLQETGRTPFSYWCDGFILFTYDANEEKLTGRATYRPVGNCDVGAFVFYRIRLKSAAKVPAATETTLRVSGRDVRWYADAALQRPVASGNTFRTRLTAPTTFYLTQGFYPTRESAVTPITIQVSGPSATRQPAAVAALPSPPVGPLPGPAWPKLPPLLAPVAGGKAAPPAITLSATPLVLPTVLFRLGTAKLLPTSWPTLAQLAAALKASPNVRVEVAGHTDRIGEPQKNQRLSEQRAAAVKAYLINAGVAAARIRTVGYGDTRPLHASPDARNRRVEVRTAQ